MMPLSKDLSTISDWLEEKLKEHFVRKSQCSNKSAWNIFLGKQEFSSMPLPYLSKGVPIQAFTSEFRILNMQLKPGPKRANQTFIDENNNRQSESDQFNLEDDSTSKTGTKFPLQTRDSHVSIVYQESSQCIGKTLLLHIQASQIIDVQGMEEITPKYELSLDEHEIDVYTQVFPLLKHWMSFKKIKDPLPVPECYYGSYQTEVHKMDDDRPSGNDLSSDLDDLFDDHDFNGDFNCDSDFLSKVAQGLESIEREKRKKEANASGNNKQSSYRLLILEDIDRHGFKLKNVGHSSTFLSLLNVEEALKSLAVVHSTSWAYEKISGDTLLKKCPFLNHPLYLSYVTERVVKGFELMERLVLGYLICSSRETKEEGERIRKSLAKLSYHLKEILEGAKHPRHIKCLIHQSTSFPSFLFRYSVLNPGKTRGNLDHVKGKSFQNDNQERDKTQEANKGSSSSNRSVNGSVTTAERHRLDKSLEREVMIINWGTATLGSPLIDVALLLLTSLPPETRRAETASLLQIYWDTFRTIARKFGLTLTWTDKELYGEYLGALLYSCVLITGNISGSLCDLDDEGMQVFIEAVKDLINEKVI